MRRLLFILLIGTLSLSACENLDVPPKGLITDEDLLTNAGGMATYLSTMYSLMPFEDFKYQSQWGITYDSWLGAFGISGTGEAVGRDGIVTTFTSEQTPYWGGAFKLLRLANHLIEALPKYKSNFSEEEYNNYLGQAYFVRAFVFYAMAKRFGGIPLVTKVIEYPAPEDKLEIPRSSEEDTWDQILKDFNTADSLLSPTGLGDGYANKYASLAYKSEAMLYAGSVAKYNQTEPGQLTGLGKRTGVRVIGFAPDKWQAASVKYFKEAYLAAREVMKSGKYSLYMKDWKANDPESQYQNMVNMFSDLSSPENILVRTYQYPTLTHGIDAYSAPFIFRAPLSSETCPTLGFLELFDGFPRYPDGSIKVTTGNSNSQGQYLMYDNPMDFFKNAEPRLRAYVIFPGDMFRGKKIEIRAGVYTGPDPVKPFFNDYSYANSTRGYQDLDIYNHDPKSLYLGATAQVNDSVKYNGAMMPAAGQNGPFFNQGESAITGLYLRKWLNPDPPVSPGEGKSAQPFILMRYAEVLLNAAEAGVELKMAGAASPDGSDMLDVATQAVNDIRKRAGAQLLTQSLTASIDGRDIVRKERRKELAFEHKTKWDLRRWRVLDYGNRDYFWGEKRAKNTFSDNSQYRFRGLYPFFSTQAGKWFFDTHFQWVSLKTFNYTPVDYYFAIPGDAVSQNPKIDQQPNR